MTAHPSYPTVSLHIAGAWRSGSAGAGPVLNPATAREIGRVPMASTADLDEALESAASGFALWRRVSAFDRSKLLRAAASLLRERVEGIATVMTLEQGKPLYESRAEVLGAADTVDWFAEEARRTYGRVIPARAEGVMQLVVREPVGPVAAFTPWNFPLNQAVRKVAAALAAGCSIIVKGPEETPASCAELVRAFADAGLPAGVLNLVFGVPAEVSAYLIPHPVIRKISFTGSTPVGKQLASLAGLHMKRATMELGGHAPAIVFDDADLGRAVEVLTANKYRNAGQVCVAPTRFLVQEGVYEEFKSRFVAASKARRVGDGLDAGTEMGPLANHRRVEAMEALVADATARGARVETGGHRLGNEGYFYAPTILTGVPRDARIMNEEPFGPIAPLTPFARLDEVIKEANRLPYGLAAYAYTTSTRTAAALREGIETGMLGLNHHGLALPETPFGGVKDSGYGSEGGTEAMEGYLTTKFVSQASG